MTNRHRCIGVQQQHRHRFAHDIAAPDYYRMFAAKVSHTDVFQHFHAARRRAAHKSRLANHQRADVLGMKTVDVLAHRNRFQHMLFGDVFRQW